jgi:hypothetical protein
MDGVTAVVENLRAEMEAQPAEPAVKLVVTVDRALLPNLERAAKRINAHSDQRLRLVLVMALVVENARLVAENNVMRERLGLEAVPVYMPRFR